MTGRNKNNPSYIRTAASDELASVMNIIDGAFLAIDVDTVRDRIRDQAVLIAVDDDRILGVLILDGDYIDAVAVLRNRREQGIGRALVEAASDRRGRLTAEFRPEVRLFYESLGFEIERTRETRCRGVRPAVR